MNWIHRMPRIFFFRFAQSCHVHQNAFTLMELMVVIFLIGVIAAFALPNYDKSVRKAHEQDMVAQLKTLHAANLMYNARNGTYWDTGANTDISTINGTLGLNLISSDGTAYSYTGGPGGGSYTAAATWQTYTISVTGLPLSNGNPCCASTNCLSIPNC